MHCLLHNITNIVFHTQVKFILMNSFSTSDDTKEHLLQQHADLLSESDWELVQNKSPKIDANTMQPVTYPPAPDMEWCPPGHGDLYPAMLGSGILQRLVDGGITYLFVSNSDNLGATLDLKMLEYFANSGAAFLMEVCVHGSVYVTGGWVGDWWVGG